MFRWLGGRSHRSACTQVHWRKNKSVACAIATMTNINVFSCSESYSTHVLVQVAFSSQIVQISCFLNTLFKLYVFLHTLFTLFCTLFSGVGRRGVLLDSFCFHTPLAKLFGVEDPNLLRFLELKDKSFRVPDHRAWHAHGQRIARTSVIYNRVSVFDCLVGPSFVF